MYCMKCGAANSGTASFCVNCAATLVRPASASRPDARIGDDSGMRMLLPVGRSGFAIAAGYIGLLAIGVFPLGPIAILFSILALLDIRRHPEMHGMGRIIMGFVGGVIGTIVAVAMIVVFAFQR